MFTLHVFDPTFILRGSGDGSGVTGEKAVKSVTAVWFCVLTFEKLWNQWIFLRETTGKFQACYLATEFGVFDQEVAAFPAGFTCDKPC